MTVALNDGANVHPKQVACHLYTLLRALEPLTYGQVKMQNNTCQRTITSMDMNRYVITLADVCKNITKALPGVQANTPLLKAFGSIVRNEEWSVFANGFDCNDKVALTLALRTRYGSSPGQENIELNYAVLGILRVAKDSNPVLRVRIGLSPEVVLLPDVQHVLQALRASKELSKQALQRIETACATPMETTVLEAASMATQQMANLMKDLNALVAQETQRTHNLAIQKQQETDAAAALIAMSDAFHALKSNPALLKKTLKDLGLN